MSITEQPAKFDFPVTAEQFPVQTSFKFSRDFREGIGEANRRVLVKTMTLEHGHAIDPILNSLKNAGQRGINTVLRADKVSPTISGDPDTPRRVDKADLPGVEFQLVNPPALTQKIPFLGRLMGRDHRKSYIADDAAWFGGLNLESNNFDDLDFMVKITKPEIVDALVKEFERKDKPQNDYVVECDSQTELLVDVGKRGQSLILDKATELVRNAEKSVQVFSLFLPDGKFVSALEEARRKGVNISIVTGKADALGVPISKLIQKIYKMYFEKFYSQLPLILDDHIVHAKLLIVDGKTVLFGSHNLSTLGVLAGTEEMAILSENPELARSLERFFMSQVERIKSGRTFIEDVLKDSD